ncbi:hypothetical protein AURDEDRAFT_165949 [Auricularia subglabra TFB-10046 SS5]|nr:hypothetical protein AURDEDRAFT_165949 [Auricularia subglabra TFB-10046 SS5]
MPADLSSPSADARSPHSLLLHMLRVTPGPPASQTSLEPFCNFILEALVVRGLPLAFVVSALALNFAAVVPVVPLRWNGLLGFSMRIL